MSRTDNIERIGVAAVHDIVTRELDWIFREQHNQDFGIDAQIELDDTDYPTGKLIGLQIKTGPSHVNIGERVLTYSTSWVHYYYWLSSNIPVVFIIHFPETKKTYWQHIAKANFRPARKNMVLQIPKKQRFNRSAQGQLDQILQAFRPESSHFRILKGKTRPNTIEDALVGIEYIPNATKCLCEIAKIMKNVSDESKAKSKIFTGFIDQELFDNDSKVKAQIDDWGAKLNIASKELEHQKGLFSEYFSIGFTSYQDILLEISQTSNSYDFNPSRKVLSGFSTSTPNTISQIDFLKNSLSGMPTKYPVLREAKESLNIVLDMIIVELTDTQLISNDLIKHLDKFTSN